MISRGTGRSDKAEHHAPVFAWAFSPQDTGCIPHDQRESPAPYEYSSYSESNPQYHHVAPNSTGGARTFGQVGLRRSATRAHISTYGSSNTFENCYDYPPYPNHNFGEFVATQTCAPSAMPQLPESDNDFSETEYISYDSPGPLFCDSASVEEDDPPKFVSSLLRDTMPLCLVRYDNEEGNNRLAGLDSFETDRLFSPNRATETGNGTPSRSNSLANYQSEKAVEVTSSNTFAGEEEDPRKEAVRHGTGKSSIGRGKAFVAKSEKSKILFGSFKLRNMAAATTNPGPTPIYTTSEGLRRISYYESVLEFDSGSSL